LGRIAARSHTRGLAGTSRSSTPGFDLRAVAKLAVTGAEIAGRDRAPGRAHVVFYELAFAPDLDAAELRSRLEHDEDAAWVAS